MDTFELMERAFAEPEVLAELAGHADWRVRYAAAVGMGETGDPRWLPVLHDLLVAEAGRDLYGQPRVLGFPGSYDDTRMAEQLIEVEPVWEHEHPPEVLETWKCRGRVRQAAVLAVHAIGRSLPELNGLLRAVLDDPDDDYSVKAAAAKALSVVGDASSVAHLERALELDEWCLHVETTKALSALRGAADA
ncbi:HEAT repeat domain-containing protein [Jiangella mangrovi]